MWLGAKNRGYTPSGGGGGGSSTLAVKVASMTPGTWASWSGGFLSDSIDNPQGDDGVCTNSSKLSWDPVRKKLYFYGKGHGTLYQSLTLIFDDATSVWTNSSNVPIAAGSGTPGHQFCGQTSDPSTGDLYFQWAGADNYTRPANTGSWSGISGTATGAHGQLAGTAFNPHFGTVGGYYVGSYYGIDVYNPASTSWTNLNAGFGAGGFVIGDNSGSGGNVGFYDEASQSIYFAGGSGAGASANLQVSKTGTITQKGSIPTNVSFAAAFNSSALVTDGYTSSYSPTSGTVRKPMIVQPGGQVWEYTSGTDSWDVIFAGTSPDTSNGNRAICIGVVPDYDCAVMLCQASNSDMNANVYRRS